MGKGETGHVSHQTNTNTKAKAKTKTEIKRNKSRVDYKDKCIPKTRQDSVHKRKTKTRYHEKRYSKRS